MKFRGALSVLVFLLLGACETRSEERPVEIQVLGLTIQRTMPGYPINVQSQGVRLTIAVKCSDEYLLMMDRDATEILSYKDDKCTDLTRTRLAYQEKFMYVTFSKDHHLCTLRLDLTKLPARGAKELHLRAKLVLKTGKGEKKALQKEWPLTVGSKMTAGPIPLTVKKVEKGGWPGAKMTVAVGSKQSLSMLKDLTLLDADGKKIDYEVISTNWGGSGKNISYTTYLALKKYVKVVSVQVSYFEKMEPVTVPIDLKFGVGL